jgi:hypothetical protein
MSSVASFISPFRLVDSLSRPSETITGMSLMVPEMAVKRLELLRELIPGISRILVPSFLAAARRPRFHESEPVRAGLRADYPIVLCHLIRARWRDPLQSM